MAVYGLVLRFLLHMLPPPTATWSTAQIADFYLHHSTEIKLGATIMSWTSAFMVPLAIVIAIQLARHEDGKPVWSIVALVGGPPSSLFDLTMTIRGAVPVRLATILNVTAEFVCGHIGDHFGGDGGCGIVEVLRPAPAQ